MAVSILVPAALRPFTEGKGEVLVTDAATVGEAILALSEQYPELKRHLYEENGSLRSFVNLYVGDSNIKNLEGLNTPVSDGGQIVLVPAIAGGCQS